MNLKFSIITHAECEKFLKIKGQNGEYESIDNFIKKYPGLSIDALNDCYIKYRKKEMSYKEYIDDYCSFSDSMATVKFTLPQLLIENFARMSVYFIKKSITSLDFARFFTLKSKCILDIDYNIPWAQRYQAQYLCRCIYFNSAITWYANSMDYILQAVYWHKQLYTSAVNRGGHKYTIDWTINDIMECCNYNFILSELKERNFTTLREILISCSNKIDIIRKWANFIKHKGGIDYKYLEPKSPAEFYFVPIQDSNYKMDTKYTPDEKYKIEDFKSPIEIDIDDEIKKLVEAYAAICKCITNIILDFDYPQYGISFSDESKK